MKRRKERRRKGGRGGKKEKDKDLTPDRTTESLFEELVMNNVIKPYKKVIIVILLYSFS